MSPHSKLLIIKRPKRKRQTLGLDVKRGELSGDVGRNTNQYSHDGKQYEESSKKKKN